jgi:hypothetical protein
VSALAAQSGVSAVSESAVLTQSGAGPGGAVVRVASSSCAAAAVGGYVGSNMWSLS